MNSFFLRGSIFWLGPIIFTQGLMQAWDRMLIYDFKEPLNKADVL